MEQLDMEEFVYTATVFSLVLLAILLIANLVIIAARVTKHNEAAQRIIRLLYPIANFFRVPGKNLMDPYLSPREGADTHGR